MQALLAFVLRRGRATLLVWIVVVVAAGMLAMRLAGALQGGTDAIPGSPSDRVTKQFEAAFGKGALYQFLVVMRGEGVDLRDPRFAAAAGRLTASLRALDAVRAVDDPWASGRPELLGRDGRTALIVVTPSVSSYFQAELLTDRVRERVRSAGLPPEFTVRVTGATAVLHDLEAMSSADLLAAERVCLPITVVVLLLVFGAPLAALLPVLLALASVTLAMGGLSLLSHRVAVSVFAENVVTMIGLGVGVDYALFVVSRFREELALDRDARAAAVRAGVGAGHAVLFSGTTVAIGFLALFLVRAPFLHTIAIGGMLAVAAAVAASLTLLPVLLAWGGGAILWPRRVRPQAPARPPGWSRWAELVMRHPWGFLLPGLVLLVALMIPVLHLRAWNIAPRHLAPGIESREGDALLRQGFPAGWMGPAIVLFEAPPGRTVWEPAARRAVLAEAAALARDPRYGTAIGFPQLAAALERIPLPVRSARDLPEPLRAAAERVASPDGRIALVALVTPGDPAERATMRAFADLRGRAWPAAAGAGLAVSVGGASGVMTDFDAELFGSLPRLVLAVVALTFLVLLVLFRSIVIPLKATLLNVASVLAAYGFLVLVFQDGVGARALRLEPPGGLQSFIVVMLFTILFGLSMDYEVFLLTRVQEAWRATGDNARAVSMGLGRTAGIITSAAVVMVTIFASFGFTRFPATREFGLGLAFAVALDATLIRSVLAPALMVLAGRANWWFPGRRRGEAGKATEVA